MDALMIDTKKNNPFRVTLEDKNEIVERKNRFLSSILKKDEKFDQSLKKISDKKKRAMTLGARLELQDEDVKTMTRQAALFCANFTKSNLVKFITTGLYYSQEDKEIKRNYIDFTSNKFINIQMALMMKNLYESEKNDGHNIQTRA
jgi:hypothetical protein